MTQWQPNGCILESGAVSGGSLQQDLEELPYYRNSLIELHRRQDYFAKFVPDTVRRVVRTNPETSAMGKHESDISVLFLDISGYTSLSERLPPYVLSSMVERYFSAFLDRIHEADGDINEIAGDGFMAIFYDTDRHKHVSRAADAALALLATTEVLNADHLDQPITVHMGLNSGTALVGLTRLEGLRSARWTFTASGLVTNLAARLADIAEPGQILIGPETAHRLDNRYTTQKMGCERLKNFTRKVDIYRLLPPYPPNTHRTCRSVGSPGNELRPSSI